MTADAPAIWTRHALQRSQERFPDLSFEDMLAEYERARKIPRKLRRALRERSPLFRRTMPVRMMIGPHYALASRRVIFIIEAPATIVTVYPRPG